MITVWELDKDVKSVQLHPLQPRSFYWIDCSHPSEHDIRALAHILSVSEDLIVDSFDPKQRPQASISGKHLALAFRGATGGVGRLSIASFGIFASKQCVITIHDKQVRGIDMLLKLSGDQRLKLMNNGAGHLLYRIKDFLPWMVKMLVPFHLFEQFFIILMLLHKLESVFWADAFDPIRVIVCAYEHA